MIENNFRTLPENSVCILLAVVNATECKRRFKEGIKCFYHLQVLMDFAEDVCIWLFFVIGRIKAGRNIMVKNNLHSANFVFKFLEDFHSFLYIYMRNTDPHLAVLSFKIS